MSTGKLTRKQFDVLAAMEEAGVKVSQRDLSDRAGCGTCDSLVFRSCPPPPFHPQAESSPQ